MIVQTRTPMHEVLQAAVFADPARIVDPELERRQLLRYPPAAALAAVSSTAAPEFVAALVTAFPELDVQGPVDGTWLIRASDHEALSAALTSTPRPGGRLRIDVDPQRL